MSQIVSINATNYDSSSGTLTYRFPGQRDLSGYEVALTNATINNQWFNVGTAYGNNVYSFKYPRFTGNNTYVQDTYTFTLTDGYYTIEQIGQALENFSIGAGLYLFNPTGGTNVFFFSIVVNPTAYTIQVYNFYLPSAAQAAALGYTNPAAVLVLNPAPTNASTLQVATQITFPLTNTVLGFDPGTYPATVASVTNATYQTSPVVSTSQNAPQVNRVTVVNLGINAVYNATLNGTIPELFATIPINSAFGYLTSLSVISPSFVPVKSTQFTEFVITLYDDYGNRMRLIDPQVTLTLSLRVIPQSAQNTQLASDMSMNPMYTQLASLIKRRRYDPDN